jgi:hypothetical protein
MAMLNGNHRSGRICPADRQLVLLAKSEYGTRKLLVVKCAVIPITGHELETGFRIYLLHLFSSK